MTMPEGKIRILLVDDSDDDRAIVRRLIRQSGFEAQLTELSRAGPLLEGTDLSGIDCILLDYNLPDADGLAVLRRVVDDVNHTSPPVIVLSGVISERLAVETIRSGADDYLSKNGLTAELLSRSIGGAIERQMWRSEVAAKTRELKRLSLYDDLSGLPNRNLYFERLDQALRSGRRSGQVFALLVMDLVAFKEVNDSLGHPAGDRLIHVIGRRLVEACRDSDTVARIGGDEFAAILPTTGTLDGAVIAAQKIEAAISEPVLLEEGPVQVGISIGIALYPLHGDDTETLYRNADVAMYEAKRLSKGCVVYCPDSHAPVPPSVMLAGHLSESIGLDQLTLHYQPKIEMATGRTVGVEALVRWEHPTLGLLPPAEFVPRIERTSMIAPMTHAVLDKALRQAADWRARGLLIPVAINLSARLLDDETLPGLIASALERYDLPSDLLTLEVTETGLMSNLGHATALLDRIQSMGVRISIDDFGTGYTSLRSLMSLPLSELKVDKIFIDGIGSNMMESAIVSSIVEISRGFDITVVAEGVESEQAWSHLAALGCHHAQGFLFCEPLPHDDFETWLAGWESRSSRFAAAHA